VDCAQWFSLNLAMKKINPGQRAFVKRLLTLLATR
jgi:predicted NUDIX family NTP pyrophosphohydrolase